MIACALYTNDLFKTNNFEVYYNFKEVTTTTAYVASIVPFQQKKDGQASFLDLVSQYTGNNKLKVEIKRQDILLHTQKWKGQSDFSLKKIVTIHHNIFDSMLACVLHVLFQLLHEFTCVKYLLDGIKNKNLGLQAVITNVYNDVGTSDAPGKRSDF